LKVLVTFAENSSHSLTSKRQVARADGNANKHWEAQFTTSRIGPACKLEYGYRTYIERNRVECEREAMIPLGFMFLHCTAGAEDTILQQIKSISGVVYAYRLDGSYDIVVKIESNSIEDFTHAIAAIRKISNILNTDTIVGFK
jgi:hypothetical protein